MLGGATGALSGAQALVNMHAVGAQQPGAISNFTINSFNGGI
jgi:hypothetical protein